MAVVVLLAGCSTQGSQVTAEQAYSITGGVRSDESDTGLVVPYLGGACDTSARAVAMETARNVTVTVLVHKQAAVSCPAIGISRIANVRLTKPLGDRSVMDGATGKALAAVRGPDLVRFDPEVPPVQEWALGPEGASAGANGWARLYASAGVCGPNSKGTVRAIVVNQGENLPRTPGPGWKELFDPALAGRPGTVAWQQVVKPNGQIMVQFPAPRGPSGSVVQLLEQDACTEPVAWRDLPELLAVVDQLT